EVRAVEAGPGGAALALLRRPGGELVGEGGAPDLVVSDDVRLQALRAGELLDVSGDRVDLRRGHALLRLQHAAHALRLAEGSARVEQERAVDHLDVVAVGEALEGHVQTVLAEATPGTDEIAPDFDAHGSSGVGGGDDRRRIHSGRGGARKRRAARAGGGACGGRRGRGGALARGCGRRGEAWCAGGGGGNRGLVSGSRDPSHERTWWGAGGGPSSSKHAARGGAPEGAPGWRRRAELVGAEEVRRWGRGGASSGGAVRRWGWPRGR